jgi:4'-phosphopantetheinyl transferase
MSVRVVSAGLDLPEPRLRELFARLDPGERARAERFVFERHRRRFTAARGLLRETLGEELAVDPGALRFEYAARGKPRLAAGQDDGLRFNVSHSEDRLLIAIGRGVELGVDIERVRDDLDHAAIARRFFSEGECSALLAQPERSRAGAFFAIWTRKEAYIKLVGAGLSIPLNGFEVSLEEPPRVLRGAPDAVELRRVDAPPGFAAALAVAPAGAISQDR